MSAPSFILVIIIVLFVIKSPITYTNAITDPDMKTLVTPSASVIIPKMYALPHNSILIVTIFPNDKLLFINH